MISTPIADAAPAGIVTRFAPSPTGRLHLGHAWSAMLAHDHARAGGGRFLLRIEDIDPGRTREGFVAGIAEDLRWLGLGWNGAIVRQSARLPAYAAALKRLCDGGFVYPCFCTRREVAAEIAASASAPHIAMGAGEGARYPGTCRRLPPAERARRLAVGDPHALRLDMARAIAAAGPLMWKDARAGLVAATPAAQGDVVLARRDAPASYHLAVTLDDAAQGITDVVRGEDLFTATHVHRLLQALLGLPTPGYRHHPLLRDARGQRLAKRSGAPALAELRARGVDPAALLAELRARS